MIHSMQRKKTKLFNETILNENTKTLAASEKLNH